MAIIKGLEWTFDTVAEQYEKLRPGYVEEMYEDIFKYRQLDKTSHAVEVGTGDASHSEDRMQGDCRRIRKEFLRTMSR